MTPATTTKEYRIMQKTLPEEFNETAAAASEAFPEELQDLVILLLPSFDAPVFVSSEIADQLTKNIADIKEAVADITEFMRDTGDTGRAWKNYSLAGTPVNMIAVMDNPEGDFSSRFTMEMQILMTLDHEIGHHILKNGMHSEHLADAFAMLRHIQRFGKDTDHAGNRAELKALSIIIDDAEHYTTDVIEGAIQAADEKGEDFFKLSLQQTAALAEKIVDEYHDQKTFSKISGAFWCVRHAVAGEDGYVSEHALRCVLWVMRKDPGDTDIFKVGDTDIFKVGKRFLSNPPIKDMMLELAKTDKYWQRALKFIDADPGKAPEKSSRRNPPSPN